MRRATLSLLGLSLILVLARNGSGGDKEAAAIIDKAIKAHFPKGVDTKNKGMRTKSKGKLHVMGLELDFTQEIAVQAESKFKDVMELTIMDKTITVVTVFNGKEGWVRAADKDIKVDDDILKELKDAMHQLGLMQAVFTKEKGLKFAHLGEHKIKGKPALGLNVSRDGQRDVSMFFDKETGLLSKVEARKRDLMSGQEVNEERFLLEYQDVEGRKVPKKAEVLRDGKVLADVEVVEVVILEKIDDSEFVQPK